MVHRPLRIVVRAESLAEARIEAEEYFEWLKEQTSYDTLTFASNTDRYWNEAPIDAIEAHKPLAKRQVRDAYDRTKREYACNVIKTLASIADTEPGLLTAIDGEGVDPEEYEQWMGLLDEWAYEDVTNPDRIDDRPSVLDERGTRNLMGQFAGHRSWAPKLGKSPYLYCVLYDVTHYHERSSAPVTSGEKFEWTLCNLDGKYVVLIDAHF